MTIDTIDGQDGNAFHKFNSHVQNNTPCIVKNLFSNETQPIQTEPSQKPELMVKQGAPKCGLNNVLELFNNDKDCFIYGCFLNTKGKNIICSNTLLDKIQSHPQYKMRMTRVWEHSNGNFSSDHYDGDFSEVLNISLTGKKRFLLAPPNSFAHIPMTNISYFSQHPSNYSYDIILEPNQMLYIPSSWHHQVYTLEDNTKNMNFNFIQREIRMTPRNEAMITVHKTFNTYFWNGMFDEESKTQFQKSFFHPIVLYYFIKEVGLYFLIAGFILFKYVKSKTVLLSAIVISGVLLQWKYLDHHSGGISNLYLKLFILLLALRIGYLFV
jgi:hypothetical protein